MCTQLVQGSYRQDEMIRNKNIRVKMVVSNSGNASG